MRRGANKVRNQRSVPAEKRCVSCEKVKKADEFYPSTSACGLTSRCKACELRARAAASRVTPPETVAEWQRLSAALSLTEIALRYGVSMQTVRNRVRGAGQSQSYKGQGFDEVKQRWCLGRR